MPHPLQRPIPADFANFAATHTRKEVEEHYACGYSTSGRWYAEAGIPTPHAHIATRKILDPLRVREMIVAGHSSTQVAAEFGVSPKVVQTFVTRNKLGPWLTRKGPDKRSIPDDFLELASSMPRDVAVKYWKISSATLTRWYKETKVRSRGRGDTKLKPPSGLADRVRGMSVSKAAKAEGTSHKIMSRWMRELDIFPKPSVAAKKAEKPSYQRSVATKVTQIGTWKPTPVEYIRDMSQIGRAADFLRTKGPVSRCNSYGTPTKDGKLWRRGSTILTDEQLYERAQEVLQRDRAKGLSPSY